MPRARRRAALPRAVGARRAHRAVLPGRDPGRRPPRPLTQLRGRTHGEGHRDGAGTATRRESAQRGPRRPRGRRGRPPWPRPCSSPPARCRGPAGSRTARPAWTPRRSRSASSARSPSASPPSSTPATGSRCSTPPARRTSSASCGPACAPPTPPCSSSPPSTGSTPPPCSCGRSAPPSACRAPSSSPSSTGPAPTSTTPSGCASSMLGEGVYPVHLVDRGPDGAVRGLVSLLEPDVDAPDADRLRARADRGHHRRERGRGPDGAVPGRRRAGPGRPDRRPRDRRRPRRTSTPCSAPPR